MITYQELYGRYDALLIQNSDRLLNKDNDKKALSEKCAIKYFMVSKGQGVANGNGVSCEEDMKSNGFERMEKCRRGLDALDRGGWKRSYHQRKFHDAFIASCARAFFKLDGSGAFQRAFQHILEINGWNNLNQEILISTPRRFGKTISVSMFAAALLYSCAGIELSIYSTCKRISQKLLRNVVKFLNLIYEMTGEVAMPIIRANCEEIHIQGPEGSSDVRVTNSYPSKLLMEYTTHHFVGTLVVLGGCNGVLRLMENYDQAYNELLFKHPLFCHQWFVTSTLQFGGLCLADNTLSQEGIHSIQQMRVEGLQQIQLAFAYFSQYLTDGPHTWVISVLSVVFEICPPIGPEKGGGGMSNKSHCPTGALMDSDTDTVSF